MQRSGCHYNQYSKRCVYGLHNVDIANDRHGNSDNRDHNINDGDDRFQDVDNGDNRDHNVHNGDNLHLYHYHKHDH